MRAQGVSDDGTRVVLEAAGRLTAADTDNENDLYLIAPGAVTMLTTGPTADPSDGVGGTLLSMSADASRILLSTRASLVASDTDGALDLYLHTSAGVELVLTAPGNPNFGIGVEFWASSADLQRVIFLTGEPLDAGDTDIDSDVASGRRRRTRSPLPSSAGPEFNGASADAETLFIRVGVPMAPGDTDNGRDIYQFSLPHVVTPPAGTFVEADGTTLTRNGQPFRLHGAAIYGTSNPHDPGDDHTTQVLDWAEDAHLNTLRLVNMFVEDGLDDSAPYRESDWVHVDQVLAEIGARGMVAVLDLSAFRNHLVRRDIRVSGHTATCQSSSRPAGIYEATDPYRAGLASEWQALIHFVTSRINTVTGVAYRDDPTIAVISLAGEPEPPNTEYCGKATDTATLTEFYRRTLAMLATEDPNHLHSTGGLFKTDWEHQCAGCGGSGIDGHAIFALADNTLPALHTYPWRFETFGKPIDFQSPDLGAYAVSLGKPWFTEEFGWPQRIGDEPRATDFRWLYALQETYGSAGALFWNLGPEVAGGSHDVNPNTPLTWAAVVAGDGSGPDPVYFVRGAGTSTQLNGQPFTFTGMNIYNANSDGWCANNMDGGLFEQALTDIDLGGVHGGNHGVIRAWFFEPLATAGLTGTRDWTRFDRTIAAAKAAGYHVIPTFGNQWGECGHKGATAPYKTIDWYRMGYTQLQPEDFGLRRGISPVPGLGGPGRRPVQGRAGDPRLAAPERGRDEPRLPGGLPARAGGVRCHRVVGGRRVGTDQVDRLEPPRQPRHDRSRPVRDERRPVQGPPRDPDDRPLRIPRLRPMDGHARRRVQRHGPANPAVRRARQADLCRRGRAQAGRRRRLVRQPDCLAAREAPDPARGRRRRPCGLELGTRAAVADRIRHRPGRPGAGAARRRPDIRVADDPRRFRLGRAVHHPDPAEPLAVHVERAAHGGLLLHGKRQLWTRDLRRHAAQREHAQHVDPRPLHLHRRLDRPRRQPSIDLACLRRHRRRRDDDRAARPCDGQHGPGRTRRIDRGTRPDQRGVHRACRCRDAGVDRHARSEHRRAQRLRDPRQRGGHRPWGRDATA